MLECACFDQPVESEGERGACAGDGRGAGASVGLQYVTVKDHCSLAEDVHVYYGAERAADEALDLMGAAGDLPALRFARGAGEGGTGKHAVLSGDPTAAAIAQPGGNPLLDRGVAQDAGVAHRDEDGAFGSGDV